MKKHSHSPQDILQGANLKCTPGRIEMIKLLLNADCALSEKELSEKLSRSKLNKSTIYRNLDAFINSGILHKAYISENIAYYELSHNCGHVLCHPHFTCTNCHRTFCLRNNTPPLAKTPHGFDIHRQQVLLEGLCPDCTKTQNQ